MTKEVYPKNSSQAQHLEINKHADILTKQEDSYNHLIRCRQRNNHARQKPSAN